MTNSSQDWPFIDSSTPEPRLPLRPSPTARKFSRWVLKRLGFKIVGTLPPIKKMVAIVAPHTSNWDFILGMFVQYAAGVKFSFMIKSSVFVPVLGSLIKALGGIPIDRKKATDITDQMIEKFRKADELILVVTPEGTRSNKKKVKSGFHRIAKGADVPIMLTKLDYKKGTLEVGEMISSDMSWEDLSELLDGYYEGVEGKNGYWMDKTPGA